MIGIDSSVGWLLAFAGLTFLFYTYVGYPLIVWNLPTRAAMPGISDPKLTSIVIAARRPGRAIARKVGDLLRMVNLDFEVVVVLDGPDPEAEEILSHVGDGRVKTLALPERVGKAEALNQGVEVARGDVLVFTDVRQRLAPGAVERLVDGLDSPELGAISGSFEFDAPDAPSLIDYYWRFEDQLRAREAAWDSAVGVCGGFYALKRAQWEPLPQGLILDDVWVPMNVVRAGKRIGYASDAKATDVAFAADATELARKVRTLTGNYQLMAWMPWVLNPARNRIWWQFVSHKLLRLMTPLASVALTLGLLLILAAYPRWLAALLVVGLSLSTIRVTRRSLSFSPAVLRMARTALLLHVALVLAFRNALRQRWDVWTDPARPASKFARQP